MRQFGLPEKRKKEKKNTDRDSFTCVWSHRYDIINK